MPKKSKSKINIVNEEDNDNDNDINENIPDDNAVHFKILSKKVLRIQKNNINLENKNLL